MAERPLAGALVPRDAVAGVAMGELQRLRELLRHANIEIDRLRREASSDPKDSLLLEANQQLILALLRGQAESALPHAVSVASDRVRQGQMQDANEQLLLAALGAQKLQSAAELAHGDQSALLALVAHELRNPLTPIRMAAALIDRAGADELPRLRAVIERQVDHVARLVGDLLDLSRVYSGKLRLQRSVVDVCSVVPEVLEVCRPAMEARHQRLFVDMPEHPLLVNGDRVRLVQVLCNLLDNASKYTPEEGAITLTARASEADLIVTVSDTGIGIRAEAIATVFHPFVQDSHATNFNNEGLGIGLTVVRELVEGHGGTVQASSAGQGQGSQFVVTIPRHAADAGADAASA